MIAEVVSIGDELTSGQRLDTNSRWLSEQLGACGVRVLWHTTVADELPAMTEVFRQASARADVVVATGGLGPTADDLTRNALAAAATVELVVDERSLRRIEALFRHRQRPMPERNRRQAMFPRGSQPIENPHGTAPGIAQQVARAGRPPGRIFALPGVPAEMREMWRASVEPAIRAALPDPRVVTHRCIRCFGAGESQVEAMLPDLIRRGRQPSVGITASRGTITLRITALGPSVDACRASMEPTVATIREQLGDLVFGEEDEELQHAVAKLLRQRGATVAVLECGTGGLLAHWLAQVGSDVVATSIVDGGDWLLTEMGTLDRAAAAEARSTAERAGALRQSARADIGLAVSTPAARQAAAAGKVHVGIAWAGDCLCETFPYGAHPDLQQTLAAKRALNVLRRWLLERR